MQKRCGKIRAKFYGAATEFYKEKFEWSLTKFCAEKARNKKSFAGRLKIRPQSLRI
ncbi:hypothetical protein [uncultured Campylobacter sp.]|uniref:hypothetical protein n=1 Tax=uncultured Campylobacter sp. TaxID=218934 RepID=UPI0026351103|nr:hypothetical protein [uncultured Campylobacter sp.]